MKAKELIEMLKNYEDKDVYLEYYAEDNELIEVEIFKTNVVLKTRLEQSFYWE